MFKIIMLAFRNILRNKRRTALTFLAIIAGITALIIFGGFVKFSFWGLRERIINSRTGHIQIYKKGYTSSEGRANPHEFLIDNVSTIKNKLKKVPHIKLVTERLSFSGLISTGNRTVTATGKGVNPETESELASFASLVEGKGINTGEGIQLGSLLKKSLGVEVGDYVTLLVTTLNGSINAMDVKVSGIISTGSKEYDEVVAKIPLDTVQTLLNTSQVEKLLVLVDKTKYTENVAANLRKLFKEENLDLELKTWQELAGFYKSVKRLYTGIFNVMKVIIAVIVFFGIANTMTMSIFERTREIGTIRAIGTKKSTTVFLFLTEGLLIGIIGGIMGVAVGSTAAYLINLAGGIYVPPPPMMTEGYAAQIIISWQVIAYSFISTVVVAIISSFYPAYRAANLDVVEALRNE